MKASDTGAGDALTVAHRLTHDLRSPLGAVATSAEVLLDLLQGQDDLRELLEGVKTSAEGALNILGRTSHLLQHSYRDAEAVPIPSGDLGLALSPRRPVRPEVTVHFPPAWPEVTAVEAWLTSAWHELLNNALRHAVSSVICGWRETAGRIVLYVRDDGPGLNEKRAAVPFPAFESLHEAALRGMSGLGLSIVQRLAARMGAACSYARTAEGLTEFAILLPPAPVPAGCPVPRLPLAQKPRPAGSDPRQDALTESGMEENDEAELDFITATACRLMGVEAAWVTLLGGERAIIKSRTLLNPAVEVMPDCPLARKVVTDETYVSTSGDGAEDTHAFLGAPVRALSGVTFGALSVVSSGPRVWNSSDIDTIQHLAHMVENEVRLRAKRRRLEAMRKRLETGEQLTVSLMEHTADCIKVLSADGALVGMNGPGRCLMEVDDLSSIEGKPWPSLWPEATRPIVEQAVAEAREGRTGRFQGFCPTAKGNPKWWDVAVTPVRDDSGTIVSLLSISRDVSDRMAAEKALLESEEKFRTLADNMSQFAWMAAPDGHIFWYNKRWFDYTGTTLEQMEGWGWKAVHHADHIDRVVEKFSGCLASGAFWEDVFPLRSAAGDYRWFLSRAVPVKDSRGNILRWFGTNTDITTQLETEEALRNAMQAKDDFIAVLSHELRTPLNPVLLIASEAVTRTDLSEDVRGEFETIRRNIENEARLIDDLLDMTRITRGKVSLIVSTVMLDQVLREMLPTIRSTASAKGVLISLQDRLPRLCLQGDDVRLRQVLWNIVSNAIKFTPEGGTVTLRLTVTESHAVIDVVDTGAGMTDAEIGRIFEPFSQGAHAEHDGPKRFGGLGLGLYISRMLVELHGGNIAAHSPGPDLGTTITLSLPLSSQTPPAIRMDTAPVPPADDQGRERPSRILLLEDHDATRRTMALLLRRRGHIVDEAATIAEAAALTAQNTYELLMSDIGLPDGRGDDFMAGLTRAGIAPPGIALSGYGMESDVQKARAAGFSAHLTKPVSLSELARTLRKVLPPA